VRHHWPVSIDELRTALRELASPEVVTGVRAIDAADLATLPPAELAAIANSMPVRQREFATGRALLRELIGRTVEMPVGPNRAPLLPADVVASLAHDRAVAIAAVSRHPLVASIGIDIEPDSQLDGAMAKVILRDDEVGVDAHLAFTLKEAAYKAWSNAGGRLLEHHEVRLTLNGTRFTAEVVDEATTFTGGFRQVAGWYVALVVDRRVADQPAR
jgi:4'-phosphopantetheinyl transferase EntD